MAHQLHYTSAATGLSGRPGFQFVAASPGATVTLQQRVAPFLSYRPPPSAPPQPTAGQLAEFPVSYGFVRDGDTAILTQCRYLGTDYSGRYGNFLGHAVVGSAAELGELLPIALWGSAVWADAPAAGPELPELPELSALPAGPGADRAGVAGWLAGPDAAGLAGYRLAELVDAVLATLEGRAGQVVLVGRAVETVAQAIAVVSHSLPRAAAQRLSFLSYTGDVTRARQHLVGTVTDAWTGAAGHSQVFRLDQPAAGEVRPPSRYASALADAWRGQDPFRLDVLVDLVAAVAGGPPEPVAGTGTAGTGRAGTGTAGTGTGTATAGTAGAADREAVAGLAALCQGDRLGPEQPAEVAALLDRHAQRLPAWVWDDLISVAEEPSAGPPAARPPVELALAVHRAALRTGRTDLSDRAGAAVVRQAVGQPSQRHRLRQVRLSTAAAAGLAEPVAQALAGATDLVDLTELVQQARALGVAVTAAGLQAGTARAVAAGRGRIGDLLRAVGGVAHPGPPGAELPGAELPAAVLPAAVLAGAVAGLSDAGASVVAAVLTDDVCDKFPVQDWSAAPVVGARVLTSRGRRFPEQRQPATAALAGLAEQGRLPDAEVGQCLRQIWAAAHPDPATCRQLLVATRSARQARERGLVELAQRALAVADLASNDAFDLAEMLYRLLGDAPDDPAAADAAAVRAVREIQAGNMLALTRLSNTQELAQPAVFARAMAAVESLAPSVLAGARPEHQARLLAGLDPDSPLYGRLVKLLLDQLAADEERYRVDFAQLTVLLWIYQVPDRRLISRLAKLASSPKVELKLQAGLQRRQRDLRAALDQLLAEYRRSGLRGLLRRVRMK